MTDKIHTLRPDQPVILHPDLQTHPALPVPEVVAMLEELLERAKKAEIRTFAYVTVDHENVVLNQWHNEAHYFTLIGGVSWLHTRLLSPDPVG